MRKTLIVVLAVVGLLVGTTPASAGSGYATDPYERHPGFDIHSVWWGNSSQDVYFDVRSHIPFSKNDLAYMSVAMNLDNVPGIDASLNVVPGHVSEFEADFLAHHMVPVPLAPPKRFDNGHLFITVPIELLRHSGLGSRTSYEFFVNSASATNAYDELPPNFGFLTHNLAPEHRSCGPVGVLDPTLRPHAPAVASAACNIAK